MLIVTVVVGLQIKTLVAAAFLGAILTALTVASVMLDPQNGITMQN